MSLKFHTRAERGQAIILVAMAFVGIIAIIGLMIDGGTLFLESSRLKRAIDAASVAAALQFREGASLAITTNTPELYEAAEEFILLNEGETYQIETFICDKGRAGDPDYEHDDLCTDTVSESTFQRKLVRVRGTRYLEFNFLPVIGIDSTTITANSVGEAATVDLILVIDSSISMADQTDGTDGFSGVGDDPTQCNAVNNCQPFKNIKDVAVEFADKLLFDYGDRIAIITFDYLSHIEGGGWQANAQDARDTINALGVLAPPECDHDADSPRYGPCMDRTPAGCSYPDCTGLNQGCINGADFGDWTSCTSSNVGGGLNQANIQFQEGIRDDSLWIVVLLAGGPANAISPSSDGSRPYGYCSINFQNNPLCRDDRASERHVDGHIDYDGDDYARDAADILVGPDGNGAIIYTIGLGEKITNDTRHRNDPYDPDIAEKLLIYIATEAGTADQGIYYNAADTTRLPEIFRQIAENIAIKISQ